MTSLIGYECITYERSVRCGDCGEMIPVGKLVYGRLYNNRSLSDRICGDCHDKREDKALNIIKGEGRCPEVS